MKETPKIVLKGEFAEIEIKDIHFCCVKECPREDITVFVGIDISTPKSKLGDTIAQILKVREAMSTEDLESDREWQITIEKTKHKQAKLP